MRKATAHVWLAALLVGVVGQAAADGGYHGGYHGHGGHRDSSFGFYLGAPLWWGPAYGSYPYYYGYSPSAVVVEQEPTVYVQRQPVAPVTQGAPGPAPLWFYCTDPAGYYPYVEHCSQTWVTVDPSTVATPSGR